MALLLLHKQFGSICGVTHITCSFFFVCTSSIRKNSFITHVWIWHFGKFHSFRIEIQKKALFSFQTHGHSYGKRNVCAWVVFVAASMNCCITLNVNYGAAEILLFLTVSSPWKCCLVFKIREEIRLFIQSQIERITFRRYWINVSELNLDEKERKKNSNERIECVNAAMHRTQ